MARDFTRTREALARFDAIKAELDSLFGTGAEFGVLWGLMNREDEAAREVGHAYGLDTTDINALDTCEACIRPGPWLRRMLAQEAP